MGTDAPDINVLMCVHNEEAWVSSAVESILNQTHSDFEFIITDDGSTDGTYGILSDYERDTRVRIIRHHKRRGLALSLNEQIQGAQGKYVARMDGDDIARKDRFDKQIGLMRKNPRIGLLGSYCREIDAEGKVVGLWMRPTSNKALKKAILWNNPFIHSTVVIPRHVFSVTGYYDPRWPYAQDYDLWLRVSRHYEVANLPEPLIDLRVNWAKVSKKNREARQCELQILANHLLSGNYPRWYFVFLIRPFLLSIMPTQLMMILKIIQRRLRFGLSS